MIAIFSTDTKSGLGDFLLEVSKHLNEDKPRKIAILWDTSVRVETAFTNCSTSDLKRFGMELLTEATLRDVAYSQEYIEELKAECDDPDSDPD